MLDTAVVNGQITAPGCTGSLFTAMKMKRRLSSSVHSNCCMLVLWLPLLNRNWDCLRVALNQLTGVTAARGMVLVVAIDGCALAGIVSVLADGFAQVDAVLHH